MQTQKGAAAVNICNTVQQQPVGVSVTWGARVFESQSEVCADGCRTLGKLVATLIVL